MPRKKRQPKGRTILTVRELAARAKWGGVLPDVPELTPEQVVQWEAELRLHGIEPCGDSNKDASRFYGATTTVH